MEHWVVITEAPGYAVSDQGRVKNLKSGRILNLEFRPTGYVYAKLSTPGQIIKRGVHNLVADAFFYYDHFGQIVNHIDGNKANNSVTNLEWTSRSENGKHAYRIGLIPEPSGLTKKTPIRIVETGEVFESQTACARAIGGSLGDINSCLHGRSKKYRGYTFEFLEEA